jgi:Mg-chelatase subunit ChlD
VKPVGLVFSIDSSGSMEVTDNPTDPKRLRVEAAKTFVSKLKNGKDKVGVVSWNGCGSTSSNSVRKCTTPFNTVALDHYMTAAEFEKWRGKTKRNEASSNPIQFVEPLSGDLNKISTAIGNVNSNGVTNPDLGLKVAIELLEQAADDGILAPKDQKVIVFLTDGAPKGSLNGVSNALTDIGSNCRNSASPAFEAKQKGYIIYAVGLGGGDMEKDDEEKLERWAECTGGMYMKAVDADALEVIFVEIQEKVEALVSYKTVCGGCEEVIEPGDTRPIELVFAIDSSGSMEVSSPPTDSGRLRVVAAKNFVDKLDSEKDKVGVVSWNGCGARGSYSRACDTLRNDVDTTNGYMTASQFELWRGNKKRNDVQSNPIQFVEPMTYDKALIKSAIETVNSDGVTNPDLGLKVAIDLLDKGANSLDGEHVIVFLTDGAPVGSVDGASNSLTDIGVNCDNTASPAFDAMQKGYSIYTIGLGGGDLQPADEDRMKRWAQCTGGVYKKAKDAGDLESVYQQIFKQVEAKASVKIVCDGTGSSTLTVTNKPTASPTHKPTNQPTKKCFASGECCSSDTSACCPGLTCKPGRGSKFCG